MRLQCVYSVPFVRYSVLGETSGNRWSEDEIEDMGHFWSGEVSQYCAELLQKC